MQSLVSGKELIQVDNMILDLTIGYLDKVFGATFLNMFGSNIYIIGAFLAIMFMFFAFKLGVGAEGTIILGLFTVFYLASPAIGSGLFPAALLVSIVVVVGIILYRVFMRL